MSLNLIAYSSFERSLKSFGPEQKEIVQRIVSTLNAYYHSNCDLKEANKTEPRFFYKQLRKPYYEAGVENKIRVIIERDKSNCYLVLAGNHDQVKKFLAGQ